MITGFNTDIEFEGVVYHVQTEGKGLETPLILSLVYVGGAILASKRSLYHDLINEGFDPRALTERLQRQHKLICAAIKAGRIEDLKRLSQRESDERGATVAPAPRPVETVAAPVHKEEAAPVVVAAERAERERAKGERLEGKKVNQKKVEADAPSDEQVLMLEDAPLDFVRRGDDAPVLLPDEVFPAHGGRSEGFIPVEAEDALHLSLLEEREFYAGEVVTIRIRISRGGMDARAAAPDVPVTVKILGTEFRPLILTTRSDRDGVATVHAWLPRFTKGRAAVLVRAALDGYTAELRRPIHQV